MKKALSTVLLLAVLLTAACAAPAPAADTGKPYVSVSFTYAEGLKYPPSYAVWIEDEAGGTVTLFATAKAATGLENRPAALPVWNGIREDADVTSGATPQKKAALTLNIPDAFAGRKLTLYIEANASYDYNDFYAEGLSEADAGYSDVNGQPSAVWAADMDTAQSGSAIPALIGAGDVLGADHALHDAGNITAPVITNVSVEWEMG